MTVKERLMEMSAPMEGVLGAMRGADVVELGEEADDRALVPLTLRDEEGRRVYERSLRFVMLLAVRQLFPGQKVRIEHSVGQGVYIRLPGMAVDEQITEAIRARMAEIAEADLPFEKQRWPLQKAIEYFRADGQQDKVDLFHYRKWDSITMYGCCGMWDYFYGAMTPSTGYVRVFGMTYREEGFVLRLPTAAHPDTPTPYMDRPKHLAVFQQSSRWCDILGVVNVADLARLIDEKHMRFFIRVNEALHDQAIADIAREIVRRGKRIVLVAGPSSSGKTTFAGRLAVHLKVLGCTSYRISLDDYYRNRDELTPEPDGSYDLESIDTLDLPLLKQQMGQLLRGETVEVPRFDFKAQSRAPRGEALRLANHEIAIFEGIHGLNPMLSEGLPQDMIHRVFVSALTCINLDDHNRIRTTDVRLLRRIVRDYQFRGTSPENTLAMWPSVRRGEETWIFPYQEQADSMFNTALHYELPILRHYAYPLLLRLPHDAPGYPLAARLRKTLNYLPDIEPGMLDEIPPLSLLREFIGGCTIDEV